MKRHHSLVLLVLIALLLAGSCGAWLHTQQQQYSRNRQLIDALVKNNTQSALALVNEGADPNTRYQPSPAPSLKLLIDQLLQRSQPADYSPTAFLLACGLEWESVERPNVEAPPPMRLDNPSLIVAMIEHEADVNTPTTDQA